MSISSCNSIKTFDFSILYTTIPHFVNFPFICSNIPAAHAYGVCISQLIRYSRACGSFQDFLDRELLLTRKLLNQGFLFGKVEVITSKIWRSPPWLGWPLWNICVTNDHGYVPLVVSTSRFFPHSQRTTGFVTRLTRRVPLVEQALLTLRSTWVRPRFLVGFVLLDLYIYMYVLLIVVCPFVFFLPLCCMFFFDIRFLIAPLVSSNFSSVDSLIFKTFHPKF